MDTSTGIWPWSDTTQQNSSRCLPCLTSWSTNSFYTCILESLSTWLLTQILRMQNRIAGSWFCKMERFTVAVLWTLPRPGHDNKQEDCSNLVGLMFMYCLITSSIIKHYLILFLVMQLPTSSCSILQTAIVLYMYQKMYIYDYIYVSFLHNLKLYCPHFARPRAQWRAPYVTYKTSMYI